MRALPFILFIVAFCFLYKLFVKLLSSAWTRKQIDDLQNPEPHTNEEIEHDVLHARLRAEAKLGLNSKEIDSLLSSNTSLNKTLENK